MKEAEKQLKEIIYHNTNPDDLLKAIKGWAMTMLRNKSHSPHLVNYKREYKIGWYEALDSIRIDIGVEKKVPDGGF